MGAEAGSPESLRDHLELARIFVNELLEEEVEEKAGQRYSHDDSRFSRWGTNPGSVRIGEEKVRVAVPRMMDTETGKTCSPERYAEMKDLPPMTGKMQEAILLLRLISQRHTVPAGPILR